MKRSPWRYLWKSEDIRKKLLITLGLLILYRLAANIPVPGIDREVIASIATGGGAAGNLFNLLDLLSGGTVSNFSILAMGVYPYITAQIILQLLVPIIPALERKMRENPRESQSWMEKWTIILTIPMALLVCGWSDQYLQFPHWWYSYIEALWFYRCSIIAHPGNIVEYGSRNDVGYLAGTIDF